MQIALLPADTADAGSARIRVYILQRALCDLGVHAIRGYTPNTTVLYVQKKITPHVLETVRRAKAQGALVIYDVDDLGNALGTWAPPDSLAEMISLADVVTVDSTIRREQLFAETGATHIEVLADAVDYFPKVPAVLHHMDHKPLRVLWFGTLGNITMFEKYIGALLELPDLQVIVATGSYGAYGLKGDAKRYAEKYPQIEFVPWSRTTFVQILQGCHLTCLMHDGSELDRGKSNNKMITSIAWGVPAVVSRTHEYERTARESGVADTVFEDQADLYAIIERLRSADARNAYLAAAQPEVWKRYAPHVIAQNFLEIVARYEKFG